MKLIKLITVLAIGLLLSLQAVSAGTGLAQEKSEDGRFAVVINAKNEFKGEGKDARDAVRRLFLKDASTWSGTKHKAKAFDRGAKDDAHISFVTDVLEMKESELAKHWIMVKQKSGETRPREVDSDRSLFKMIAKYDGALGFAETSSLEDLPEGTKVLFTFGEPEKK